MPHFGQIFVTYRVPSHREKDCGIEGSFVVRAPEEALDLSFHAARYTSAEQLECALEDAQDTGEIFVSPSTVHEIATACGDDGGSYGNIPCLGGDLQEMWAWMVKRAQYILFPEKRRYYRSTERAAKERNFR